MSTKWTDVSVRPKWWLCAYVGTDVPGYRKVAVGGTVVTVTSDNQRFPEFIADLDTALSAESWAATVSTQGQVQLSGASATLVWTDRLGWLCGMATDPADTEGTVTSAGSRIPPPGCIPLLAVHWSAVERVAEDRIEVDRWRRGHGYVWGSAEVWRVPVTMFREAELSLALGACLSGKVTLTSVVPDQSWSDTAWSSSNPTGYVEGYIIGVEGGRYTGPDAELYECTLLLAAEVGS